MAKKEGEEQKTQASGAGEEPKSGAEARPRKGVEDRLDDIANRFSKAMSEGVRRMEGAFDKGIKSVRENPELSKAKIRGFFSSSTGGGILVIVGFIWLFYAIGLLDKPVFPIIVILLGLYLLYRHRDD
ncbi:MAG: hypothetical protein ACE5EO_12795 [Candidatus Krumholzibacteriia bacterium]